VLRAQETERALWDRGADPRAREVSPGGDAAAAGGLADEVGRSTSTRQGHRPPPSPSISISSNLAEESHRIRALRERERSPEPIRESLRGGALAELRAGGVTAEQMAALLRVVEDRAGYSPPTRPKPSGGRCSRSSSGISRPWAPSRSRSAPRERAAELEAIRAEVTALWLTDRTRTARPAVTDEVRTGPLLQSTRCFWTAAARRGRAGFGPSPALPAAGRALGWLTPGLVDRRDRDGNPSVAAPVTAETLRLHRGLAVERHRRGLLDLARRLSMERPRRCPPPPALEACSMPAGRSPCAPAFPRAALRQ